MGNRGEASALHTPALAFPKKATYSSRLTGADLQGNVVEGVHIGSTTQQPLIQDDHEDEVDVRQEAQPHVHQQEGQVEELWSRWRGGLNLGPVAGREGGRHPFQAQFLEMLTKERAGRLGSNPNTQLAYQALGSRACLLPILSQHPDHVGLLPCPLAVFHSYSRECHSTFPCWGSPGYTVPRSASQVSVD